jgi:hypothetical protein
MKTLKTISLSLVLLSSVFLASAQKSASNIDKITAAYFSVKDALAAGNAAGAQNNAKQLFAALSLQPDKGLNAGQQKALNTYLDKLKFDSRHISETNAIDHQREHFASLSKNMYEVLKSAKTNTKPIYMQYCPMKKAYWLSESTQIKNPYYNDKMMTTCGSTKATLAAVK